MLSSNTEIRIRIIDVIFIEVRGHGRRIHFGLVGNYQNH